MRSDLLSLRPLHITEPLDTIEMKIAHSILILIVTLTSCTTNNSDAGLDKNVKRTNNIEQSERVEKRREQITNRSEAMDVDVFWEIIALTNIRSNGDYKLQLVALRTELLKYSGLEILQFDNRFKLYQGEANTWDLWAAAYIIWDGCNEDCFEDFRGWLVTNGQTVFRNVLNDPQVLVYLDKDSAHELWDGFTGVVLEVYREKTGKRMPPGGEDNFYITGEEWSDEGNELMKKYPKLWLKFNDN